MKTRKLGNLQVSEIGMGCMGLSHGYGQIPAEEYSVEAIRKAAAYGCTFFDTAEVYGPNLLPENKGHNECILAKAFVGMDRKKLVIATKLHLPPADVKAAGSVYDAVKAHLEASLERLQTSYTGLYYLHRINADVLVEGVAEAMGKLVQDGLIRGWGLSQVTVDTISKAHAVYPITAIQNIYSMVERGIEAEVIPYCLEHNIGIVPFSPIASGFLSGKVSVSAEFEKNGDVRRFVPQLTKENIAANQPILDVLERFSKQKSATKAQISLARMLHKYPNVVPIPGSKSQERILENLRASEVELTDEEFAALEEALNACEVHGHRGFDEADGRSFLNRQ